MTLAVNLARRAFALAAITVLAVVPGSALAQSAASFIVAIGEVQVVDAAGQARAGERGGPLAPGDRVVTGASGLAQVRFSDGAMLSIRANSELKIEAHSFRGERDTLATTVLQLLRGGLRAITGAVARQNRSGYRVVTPTATIGVRGTDFEAFYVPAATPGVALPGEPGTYLRVTRGVAFLQTPQGSLDVQPQQTGFVPITAIAPQLLPQTPQFMLAPSRPAPGPGPVPAPRSQPPQRSQGGSEGSTVRQIDPGRTLTAPSTSPTLSPELTSPTTISPTPIAPTTAPTPTSPTTSPTMTSPTLSPGITRPATTTTPMTAPSTTSPMLSPGMTSPPTTAPPR